MGQCQGWWNCSIKPSVLITLCASLIGMSPEQKACSDDHWLPGCALSHQSGPDSLVTQAFANIVKTMFALVISQMIAMSAGTPFQKYCICTLSICIRRLSMI